MFLQGCNSESDASELLDDLQCIIPVCKELKFRITIFLKVSTCATPRSFFHWQNDIRTTLVYLYITCQNVINNVKNILHVSTNNIANNTAKM